MECIRGDFFVLNSQSKTGIQIQSKPIQNSRDRRIKSPSVSPALGELRDCLYRHTNLKRPRAQHKQ